MRPVFLGVLLTTTICAQAAFAQGTYGGYDCTVDCSGHAAGYKWAEQHDISDPNDCPLPNNSPSFQEGCMAYAEGNAKIDPDEDDNGDMVGHSSRRPMDDDDDDDKQFIALSVSRSGPPYGRSARLPVSIPGKSLDQRRGRLQMLPLSDWPDSQSTAHTRRALLQRTHLP
jgi:hypothetical protein